ncbi:MAG: hypothetical protein JWR90_610 [Marmoricola sp.]|jgi:hypothetical protein|nr:hypothetical protein [Marmoricola sp.]
MTTLNYRYPAIQGEGEGEYEDELEGEYEFEFEAEAEAELESETELEDEFEEEAEEEAEGFVNPVRRIYRDAELMAHLSMQAAATRSEAEAEQFIGALVPLAARLIPRAASLLSRNAPTLMRGTRRIVRQLRRNPRTRRLVAAMPVVLQRTAQSLADQAASGGSIDADAVIGTLGTMTDRVLRGSGRGRAMRSIDVFNRRWHRRAHWARNRGPGYSRRAAYGVRPPVGAVPRSRAYYRRPAYGRVNRRVRRR